MLLVNRVALACALLTFVNDESRVIPFRRRSSILRQPHHHLLANPCGVHPLAAPDVEALPGGTQVGWQGWKAAQSGKGRKQSRASDEGRRWKSKVSEIEAERRGDMAGNQAGRRTYITYSPGSGVVTSTPVSQFFIVPNLTCQWVGGTKRVHTFTHQQSRLGRLTLQLWCTCFCLCCFNRCCCCRSSCCCHTYRQAQHPTPNARRHTHIHTHTWVESPLNQMPTLQARVGLDWISGTYTSVCGRQAGSKQRSSELGLQRHRGG